MTSLNENSLFAQIWKPTLFERHLIWLPQQKLGYIRVPKAANSSIRYRLAQTFNFKSTRGLRPNSDRFWSELDKSRAVNLRADAYLKRPDRDGAWLFTFVRNPITRIYSCWNNKIIENKVLSRAFRNMGVELGMDFPDFVQKVCDAPDDTADIHVRSQHAILSHDGQLLPHFVGRLEQIERDWAHVRFETHARGTDLGPLPHVNIRLGVKTNPMETIPAPLLQQICLRYERDFRLFYPEIWQNIMS